MIKKTSGTSVLTTEIKKVISNLMSDRVESGAA